MKKYKIIKLSNYWSTETLKNEVEILINKEVENGYEIISVSFGVNLWWIPTAYITICK